MSAGGLVPCQVLDGRPESPGPSAPVLGFLRGSGSAWRPEGHRAEPGFSSAHVHFLPAVCHPGLGTGSMVCRTGASGSLSRNVFSWRSWGLR